MDTPFSLPMMDTRHIKRKWLDIPYASQSQAQRLDIYLPDEGTGPYPVLVGIHGGAFPFGDKGDIGNQPLLKALERGFAFVSINYRLSGEAQFPCQSYDCKAAIRYVRANSTKYNFSDQVGVWGASAGGHLVALLGTSAGVKELEDLSMCYPNASSRVQAVVDWCGPAENFIRMDEEFRESGKGIPDHSDEHSPESDLLGQTIGEVPDLVKFASPMTYISADLPYFLIQHGSDDPIVPVQQSENFAAAIRKVASDKVILEILKRVGHHGDPRFEIDENIQRVLDFLDSHLK